MILKSETLNFTKNRDTQVIPSQTNLNRNVSLNKGNAMFVINATWNAKIKSNFDFKLHILLCMSLHMAVPHL